MNPLFRIDFSISDSLKIVRKSVLIYETIISDIPIEQQIVLDRDPFYFQAAHPVLKFLPLCT